MPAVGSNATPHLITLMFLGRGWVVCCNIGVEVRLCREGEHFEGGLPEGVRAQLGPHDALRRVLAQHAGHQVLQLGRCACKGWCCAISCQVLERVAGNASMIQQPQQWWMGIMRMSGSDGVPGLTDACGLPGMRINARTHMHACTC